MKKTSWICLASIFALAPYALSDTAVSKSATTKTTSNSETSVAITPAPTSDEKSLMVFGWLLGAQSGVTDVELSPAEEKIVFANFQLGAEGKECPVDMNQPNIQTDMETFLKKRLDAKQKKIMEANTIIAAKNEASAKSFFEKLDQDKSIQKTASGLRYHIGAAGDATKKATPTDLVTVLYTGKLIDGAIFDSTASRNNEPAVFPVSGVIPGVGEGLQLVGEGGKITLYIPAELGYGNHALPGIPLGSALIFDFEIKKVTGEKIVIDEDIITVE
jgi:FKBP-type peptidyl-prolyl cis-trans isomerase FkpA